ncbi:Protein phosphatase 2C [Tenacibaculum sp. MAR_2009_124]|uniref:protein phosphatase 2C domain-containing protein n=1 Tax=Tenacibaculum sp. MAR_2009_124 TaxID=1250059 RepID=UPI00089AF83B|nr:protein phosphatase 2C domain-containing protein [Tenacibaculum sp. MAR_2009_124]SEC40988.1 Protein phosphatase 2C [Tenacibaculum sp. MAR_2009_124]
MKIYKTLKKGEFHTHHCEDFFVIENLSDTEKLIAVMDGCSMGKESVFASHLFGKVLRGIAKQNYYKDFVKKTEERSLKTRLKEVLEEMFHILNTIKRSLYLEYHEMLSTLILGIVKTNENKAEIIVVGDGLVCIDSNFKDFEQNDKPDYLGYHLTKDFNTWFENHNQFISIQEFKDLSICTDGIYSFKNLKTKEKQKSESEIAKFFMVDKTGEFPDNFLDRKVLSLEKDGYIPTDDLAIIRILV